MPATSYAVEVCNHRNEFEQDTAEKKVGCNSITASTGTVNQPALYPDAMAIGTEGSLVVEREYSSIRAAFEAWRDVDPAQPIPFDSWNSGWSHDFERNIVVDVAEGEIFYVRPDGENTQSFFPPVDEACGGFGIALNTFFGGEFYEAVQMSVVGDCAASSLGELEVRIRETDGSLWKFAWAYGGVYVPYEVIQPDGYVVSFAYFEPGSPVAACSSSVSYEAGRLCQIQGDDGAYLAFAYHDPSDSAAPGLAAIASITAGPSAGVEATRAIYSYTEESRSVADCTAESLAECEGAWSERPASDPSRSVWLLTGVDHQRQGGSGWQTHSSESYVYTDRSFFQPDADPVFGYDTSGPIRVPLEEPGAHERAGLWLLRRVLRGTPSGDSFVQGHEYTRCGLGASDEKSGAYEWLGYVQTPAPQFECDLQGEMILAYTNASTGELREYRVDWDEAALLEVSDDCGCSGSATNFERSTLQVNAKSDATGVRIAYAYDSEGRPILAQHNWDGDVDTLTPGPFPSGANGGKPVRVTRYEYAENATAATTVESQVFSAPCETPSAAFGDVSCASYPPAAGAEPMLETDYDPDTSGGYNEVQTETRPARDRWTGWTAADSSSLALVRQERETAYEYSGTRLTAVVDPLGARTEYRYHAGGLDAGRLREVAWLAGAVDVVLQRYSGYDSEGRPGRIEDENGAYELLSYDLDGRLSQVVSYDVAGTAVRETRFVYRADDKLLRTEVGSPGGPYVAEQSASTAPGDAPSALSFCNQQEQTDVATFQTRWQACLEGLSALEKTTSTARGVTTGGGFGASESTSFTYDLSGRPEQWETVDRASEVFAKAAQRFDAAGRPESVLRYTDSPSSPSGVQTNGYDLRGLLVAATDPRYGDVSAQTADNLNQANRLITYNAFEQVETVTVGAGTSDEATTQFLYDAHGNLAEQIDANGRVTAYLYDDFGQLLAVDSPDTGRTQFAYNAVGDLIEMTYADGQRVEYLYDDRQRLTVKRFGGAPALELSYVYDSLAEAPASVSCPGRGAVDFDPDPTYLGDRLSAVFHESGATYFSYDSLGQVVATYEQPGPAFSVCDLEIVRYRYDGAGRLIGQSYPSGRVVDYIYDTDSLYPSEVRVDGQAFISDVRYAPGGTLAGYTSSTITLDASWNLSGESTQRRYEASGGGDVFSWDVATRDENGNVLQARELAWNQRQDFTYDTQERLIATDASVEGTETVPLGEHVCAFGYDGSGNRLTERCFEQSTIDYSYDSGSSRLASLSWAASEAVCGPSASTVMRDLTRDARGRTTAVYRDGFAASPDVFGLRYGTFGRLSAVDTDGDGNDDFGYRYDDLGLRRSKSDVAAGTSHRFHYTLSGELLGEASTSVSRDYIWVAGELIGVVSDGSVYHVATDHLGTPRRAYDGTGALAWAVDVEAFGRAHSRADAIQIPIRYPGQYEDAETGLHYNRARFYDPSTGRYLTPDPRGQFGGDLTLFGYAASNPGRYTDAEGESAVADAIPVAIGLAVADGPVLPFGDAAGAVVLAGALAVDIALAVVLMNQDNSDECGSAPPAAMAGGKNDGKLSKDKRENLDARINDAREAWQKAKAKPSKTKEDKKLVEKLKRQYERLRGQKRGSESHGIDNERH
ncbi:MAG: RHS repeat-associated core domain-containing protein [Myxococcota bacterium]